MYKQDLAFSNSQWLISHKNKPNQNIPQSKINLNTKLQAISFKTTMNRGIKACSLDILPDNTIDKKKSLTYFSTTKPFIIFGDLNSYNDM